MGTKSGYIPSDEEIKALGFEWLPQRGVWINPENSAVLAWVHPPIPIRSYDWCVFEDGEEESEQYGWGATPAEALKEWIELEED